MSIEISQIKIQKEENNEKKKNRISKNSGTISKDVICVTEISEAR